MGVRVAEAASKRRFGLREVHGHVPSGAFADEKRPRRVDEWLAFCLKNRENARRRQILQKISEFYAGRRNGEANLVSIIFQYGGMPYFVNSEFAFAAGFPCARAVIHA